jgi:hypothetical protein
VWEIIVMLLVVRLNSGMRNRAGGEAVENWAICTVDEAPQIADK